MNLSTIGTDILKFLETVWIPIAEVTAGAIIGPKVKRIIFHFSAKSPDKAVMTFLGSAASMIIISISVILAAESLGVKMNSVIALLSALGLGISLALKENMANVAGGIQILLTKPFLIGEYIQVGDLEGKVTAVELMFTTLTTTNNKEVVVPNSTVISDTITNYSRMPEVRVDIPFSFSCGTDLEQMTHLALQAAQKCSLLSHEKKPEVIVSALNSSQITMTLHAWCRWQDEIECTHQLTGLLAANLPYYSALSVSTENVYVENKTQSSSNADSGSQNTDSAVQSSAAANSETAGQTAQNGQNTQNMRDGQSSKQSGSSSQENGTASPDTATKQANPAEKNKSGAKRNPADLTDAAVDPQELPAVIDDDNPLS